MVELAEIVAFIKDQTGCDKVAENSDITEDLGVYGDDFDELIVNFSKKFNVDISSCLWYFHCCEEGNSIGGAFFKSPDKRVKHIPVTPLMLFEFAQKGKWDIQYPDHKLPKRRYDILINQVLIVGFVIFLIYKWTVR
jgi:hypothetical protein